MILKKVRSFHRNISAEYFHQAVSWGIVCCLLGLRIFFLAGMRLVYGLNTAGGHDWVNVGWQIGTYLLTVFLIWWERDNLLNFNFDFLTIIIVTVSVPAETLIIASGRIGIYHGDVLAFPMWGSLIIWAIALCFILVLWLNRKKFPPFRFQNLVWLFIGLLLGVIWNYVWIVAQSPDVLSKLDKLSLSHISTWVQQFLKPISIMFVYHLGASASMEEPLFRGFLWGLLRRAGWKDLWIWGLQALLFDFAHIYYWRTDSSSIASVFLAGLFWGFLAWRSKSVSTSIVAHSITNAWMYS